MPKNEIPDIPGYQGANISTEHRARMKEFVDSHHLGGRGAGAFEGALETLFMQVGVVMDYIATSDDALRKAEELEWEEFLDCEY